MHPIQRLRLLSVLQNQGYSSDIKEKFTFCCLFPYHPILILLHGELWALYISAGCLAFLFIMFPFFLLPPSLHLIFSFKLFFTFHDPCSYFQPVSASSSECETLSSQTITKLQVKTSGGPREQKRLFFFFFFSEFFVLSFW